MIVFKHIRYKNFLSTGNSFLEIPLNRHKTSVIIGKNGCGKSTLLDTIFFALYGKAYRNINKPQLVNCINNSDCVVEMEFSVSGKDYKVVRGIKPNKFEIYENGHLVSQDASVGDYQKVLEDKILGGLNEAVFKQVVVIGSADYRPFMQLKAAERREIIEELLDIKIFSQMLELVKDKTLANKDTLKDVEFNISMIEEKIDLQKTNNQKIMEEKETQRLGLSAKIDEELEEQEANLKQIKELQERRDLLAVKLQGEAIVVKATDELKKFMSNLRSTQRAQESSISFFEQNDECPTCKQSIEQHHKDEILTKCKAKAAEVGTGMSQVQEQINRKAEFLEAFAKIRDGLNKTEKSLTKLQSENNASERLIQNYKKQIAALENSTTITDSLEVLSQYEEQLHSIKERRFALMDERLYYDVVSGMLKDGGIKTKIIRQYIPLMNKIINDYLVRLGLPIEFTLDEQFNEVIKSRYRDMFGYNNFSEGEKQRIDTSLLLAWRHLAKSKNTTNTNLLILDEVFDSSLDAHATEELLNILLEMDKDTNIFVISHKTDLSEKMEGIIEFEKQGNFTKLKAIS